MNDNDEPGRRAARYAEEMAAGDPPFRGDEMLPVPDDLSDGQDRVREMAAVWGPDDAAEHTPVPPSDDPDRFGVVVLPPPPEMP